MKNFPNFLIIGAAKSGTTSLYHYLNQHPEIFMSPVKETNFFALNGRCPNFKGPGDNEHIGRFSISSPDRYQHLFRNTGGARAVGEASPWYLYSENAPGRISEILPEAKIIVILRDPVERAFSQYLMFRRDGREPCGKFRDALRLEDERAMNGWEWAWRYRDVGNYAGQLERYFQKFPKDQILILFYEFFQKDPFAVLQKIFDFLGVSPSFKPDVRERHNRSILEKSAAVGRFLRSKGIAKSFMRRCFPDFFLSWGYNNLHGFNQWRPYLKSSERSELAGSYAEDKKRLESLLGIQIDFWSF